MKLQLLVQSLLFTGSIVLFLGTPALGEEVIAASEKHQRKIEPIKSAQKLVQAPTSAIAITRVKLNLTGQELEIILQTAGADKLQPVNRSEGNNFIADIPNAQLRLSSGNEFRQENPAGGIRVITVTNVDANTVRVIVTGEASQPKAELFDSNEGLIFGVAVTGTTPTQEQPEAPPKPEQQKPTTEVKPEPAAETETPEKQPSAEAEQPIELVVTGEQDSYRVPEATAGTRTDTPLRDIPQAIQVIPRQVIEDQQVDRLSDALRNTAGVTSDNSPRSAFEGFTIRGFSNRNIIRNGLRDDTNLTGGSGIANIEQIEVLKGPAGALFGQGGAGGTINIVTKKPLSNPFYSIQGSIGNYDYYDGSVDLTGPLNDSKTVLYRLNASALSTGTFIDFSDIERYFIAPTLTFKLGKNTQLSLEAEYLDTKQRNDRGLPAIGSVLPNPNGNIPISRFVNEPSIDRNNRQVWRFGHNLEHNFSEDWKLRNSFRAALLKVEQNSVFPTGLLEDNRTLERGLVTTGERIQETYILETNVVGKFRTGSIEHQVLVGVDLSRDYSQATKDNFFREIRPLDLFNPQYGRDNIGSIVEEIPSEPVTADILGIYLQDQIALTENLKILLGGRFDIVSQTLNFSDGTQDFQQDEAFSPRLGIVYQPSKSVSLYASYSSSFQQVTGTTFDRRLFEPERATQYEVGVKTDFTDRLSATLAFYQINRSNVLTTDLRDLSGNSSIQTGEQRSRGIELDVAGEILPGLKVIGGYAYTDARVTEDNDVPEGNRINNVPENAFSLWTTYEIPQGSLQGLGFGLGFFYVGEREGDLQNSFKLPSYVRTDAALFYRRDSFRAALNIQNLFNTDYFESAENELRVFPGSPTTVKFTLGWQF